MKILVLGNGFDLDHNLPTSYKDFLDFCDYVLHIDSPNPKSLEKLTSVQCEYIKAIEKNQEIKETFLSFIRDNPFLKYFTIEYERQGNDWIDFEREIKNIITEFKLLEYNLSQSSQFSIDIDKNHIIHGILEKLGLRDVDSISWNDSRLLFVHKRLCCALNDFSIALEYYIAYFINNTPITSVSPNIIDFDADMVLTFNYSNTYERIYGGVRWGEVVDHVHGVAIGNLEEPNIILGFTRTDKELSANNYVEFEKYFQRITKKTGNKYSKWLSEKGAYTKGFEILFFGHSLDPSDSDIIRDLVYNEKSRITVLYHNEKALQNIVANLTDIIEKKDLIAFVSGDNPKIVFEKQKEREYNDTAGIEIERDVRNLYKLHLLDDSSIDALLKKIENKVTENDLAYFFNQRKTIDLFEALRYLNIRTYDCNSFFDICKCLKFEMNKKGKLIYYHYDEWYGETSYGAVIKCDEDTKLLIDFVNKDNEGRIKELESMKLFSKIQTMQTSEEIKMALLEIFSEANPTKQYWEDLTEVIESMAENKLFEEALHLINQENLSVSVRAKLKHFEYQYEEHCVNLDFARQIAEENKTHK